MTVTFSVPGEPKGKGRPKFSSRRVGDKTFSSARTPDDTVLYENLIRTEYRRQCGDRRFGDNSPLCMTVWAYYAIPKSITKRKRAAMLSGLIRPVKKPDADNVLKVVGDALNQLVYRDDAQIYLATVEKFYADVPRMEIIIAGDQPIF